MSLLLWELDLLMIEDMASKGGGVVLMRAGHGNGRGKLSSFAPFFLGQLISRWLKALSFLAPVVLLELGT